MGRPASGRLIGQTIAMKPRMMATHNPKLVPATKAVFCHGVHWPHTGESLLVPTYIDRAVLNMGAMDCINLTACIKPIRQHYG
jgi:hypothetical protein